MSLDRAASGSAGPALRWGRWLSGASLCVVAAAVTAPPAAAQMFHLYLNCAGKVLAQGRSKTARIDLAMRDNNQTALIQDSDVLPIGERLRYVPTRQAYTMVYRAPLYGTVGAHDWYGWPLFVWYPDLRRLTHIRLVVDRQTGRLTGAIHNAQDEVLASLDLNCQPSNDDDQPASRF